MQVAASGADGLADRAQPFDDVQQSHPQRLVDVLVCSGHVGIQLPAHEPRLLCVLANRLGLKW